MKQWLRIFAVGSVLLWLVLFSWQTQLYAQETNGVQLVAYEAGGAYLLVELLDDDLVHFETGLGEAPDVEMITVSPMVANTDYAGPTSFDDDGNGMLTTADLQIKVDTSTLCVSITDVTQGVGVELTAVCPFELEERKSSLIIDPKETTHVYGLGEKFRTPGETNGDWVGDDRGIGIFGNQMEGFSGGAVGNAQFPVMYGLGDGMQNYAIFADVVYKQEWEFVGEEWSMTTSADAIRWYFLSGADLPDLRADYMELVGRPPVPPKPLFGLWVSEYGYDNWEELDDKRATLTAAQFPQDGFVLDLQWFGGIQTPSQMGSLSWDEENFPNPDEKIEQLRQDEGVDIVVIEESYVDRRLSNYGIMASKSYLVKACDTCGPAEMRAWWGNGGMVDWTNEEGAAFWHDEERQHLIDSGVIGHWTDLGEPEIIAPNSWYFGLEGTDLHDQLSNHNVYNLKWAESIFEGYGRHDVSQRPAILSRSGTSGIQRYGATMWSADIGTNLESLATHMNAQMHMSFSGVDYFGSDIGGFHRGGISEAAFDELYTVWFANSALLDVPVRPHTENLCNCKETSPDRVGDLESNLANIRLRYALTPYFYSVAHDASLSGAPVVPPLVFYYQDDVETRELGDHKMIGRDLLVRTVTDADVSETAVYLPSGVWVDYYTGETVVSGGEWIDGVPTLRDGRFQLPVFARAGGIVPHMFVDEQTMNLSGMRRDGTARDELIIYVVPSAEETRFTLVEDDGRTIAYLDGEKRTVEIKQQQQADAITIDVGASDGGFAGANDERLTVFRVPLATEMAELMTAVEIDGQALDEVTDLDEAEIGYMWQGAELWIKGGVSPIAEGQTVQIMLEQPEAAVEDAVAVEEAVEREEDIAETADEEMVEEETAVEVESVVETAEPEAGGSGALYGIGLAILALLGGGWFYARRES